MRPLRAGEPSSGRDRLRAFLRASAEASALVALGSRAQAMPGDPEGLTWTRGACSRCGGALRLGAVGGNVVCAAPDGTGFVCLEAGPPAPTVAGVVLVTRPGAAVRVAARLAREPGLALAGGDGQARVGAVWEARPGAASEALEALAARLVSADPDLVAVHPTFLGREDP